jgi:flagellar biosynthetic protein FlhB
MAEDFPQSRTEAPTQRRREEARAQGQVAVSRDLTSSLVLLAGLAGLALLAQTLGAGLLERVRHDVLLAGRLTDLGQLQAQGLLAAAMGRGLELVGFLLGLVFLIAVAAGVVQVGVQVTPAVLAFQWERLSPARGWAKILSVNAGMAGLISLVKVAAVLGVAYAVLRPRWDELAAVPDSTLPAVAAQVWGIILRLGLAVAGALALLGLADYVWQRWRFEQSLRMTRQELKEEVKREEGDPQLKARIRKLQRQAAQKRMLQDVLRATVVVTNPTHLAVALRYERGSMAAPVVVAKGAGVIALRIADIARRHAVPVHERKPLAQALYKAVKVGQEIPVGLYQAVAEFLAYVYRLRAA